MTGMSNAPPASLVIRVDRLEHQAERIASDTESEKSTRSRVNAEFMRRFDKLEADQRKLERIIYAGIGILGVLQVIAVPLFTAWLTK